MSDEKYVHGLTFVILSLLVFSTSGMKTDKHIEKKCRLLEARQSPQQSSKLLSFFFMLDLDTIYEEGFPADTSVVTPNECSSAFANIARRFLKKDPYTPAELRIKKEQ